MWKATAKCKAKETKKAAGSTTPTIAMTKSNAMQTVYVRSPTIAMTKSKKETKKAGDSIPLRIIAITKAKEEAEKAGGSIRPTIPMDARKETAKKKDQETRTFTRNELWVHISEEMHGMLWHGEKRPWSQCLYEADQITDRIFANTRPRLRM